MPAIRNGLFCTVQKKEGVFIPSGLAIRPGQLEPLHEGVSFPLYGNVGALTMVGQADQVPYGYLICSSDWVQRELESIRATPDNEGALDFLKELACQALRESNLTIAPEYWGVVSRTGVIIDTVGPCGTEAEARQFAEFAAEAISSRSA